MEGRGGHFEAQADKHQGDGEIDHHRMLGIEHLGDAINVGGSGRAEHHGDTVKEERGRKRSQQEVFERRLGAFSSATSKSRQDVGRDRRDLERDEDQHQLDGRRHQHHAYGRKQYQGVVFAGLDPLDFEVVERAEHHDQRDQQIRRNERRH